MRAPTDPAGLHYGAELVVAGLAARHAARARRRDDVAVVAGSHGRTWTELDQRVHRTARWFVDRGIGRGDLVALLVGNRVEFFEMVLALAELGAVAAPQSPRGTFHELAYGLDATGARLLIVADDPELVAVADSARSDLGHRHPDVVRLSQANAEIEGIATSDRTRSDEQGFGGPEEDDAFWLALTGGTTGPPKLVRVPHRVIVQMWLFMIIEFEITRRDTMLIAGSLHHGLGFGFALQQLYMGGRVVVLPRFGAREALDAIAGEGVTVLPAAPAMLTMMLDELDVGGGDVGSIRSIVSAGSPLHAATKRRILDAFPDVALYEHYGATEAGFFTVLHPEDQLQKAESCGEAFFGSAVRVLRHDGSDAAPGEVGLVYKRGLVQGGGYVGHPEATAEMFHGDWATVGDVGYLDEDGYLYLVDRQRDMILSGGVNVYPAEIEAAISTHPSVSEVAVVGVPDESWGEVPKAFVVRRPGTEVDGEGISRVCTDRLAAYKRPRVVEFVDELPKTSAGKVLKRELRDREWAGRDRSIGGT